MGELPGHEAMERLRRDDESALEQLVAGFGPALLRFAERTLGDRGEAEDVLQEVFVRVWRARHRWQPTASVHAYLFTIAARLCLNRKRGRARRPVLESLAWEADGATDPTHHDPDPERLATARQLGNAIERELGALPASQRAALLLRSEGGLSYQEIAAALDTTAPAVESLLSRARSRLRERLAGWTEGRRRNRG